MELYKEILMQELLRGEVRVSFPELQVDAAAIVEEASYRALEKIKAVIADDSLEDAECFMRIEEIISALEQEGIDCGPRHDFG